MQNKITIALEGIRLVQSQFATVELWNIGEIWCDSQFKSWIGTPAETLAEMCSVLVGLFP